MKPVSSKDVVFTIPEECYHKCMQCKKQFSVDSGTDEKINVCSIKCFILLRDPIPKKEVKEEKKK